jgi:hypothetical protein
MDEDEAWQGSIRTSAEAAAAATKTTSDSAEAVRVTMDQFQRQFVAHKEAHEQELA